MKKQRMISLVMVLMALLTGCASLEHNQSNFKAVTEDGLVVAEDKKNAYTLTIFPATEKVTNVSKAYSGAAVTNNNFHMKNEAQKHRFSMEAPRSYSGQNQSGILPEGADSGEVVFPGNSNSRHPGVVALLNNSEDYDVRVLEGPFADGMPLAPGESSRPVSKGSLANEKGFVKIKIAWLNKKSGQKGEKTIWRQLEPGVDTLFVSKKEKY